MTDLNDVPASRLKILLQEGLPYRALTVPISRADERRLRRFIRNFNGHTTEPMDPYNDDDLATVLAGCASHGLREGETDDGVWTTVDGLAWRLPRPNRSPLRKRIKYAYMSAVRTWRST